MEPAPKVRLYVEADLSAEVAISPREDQSHYLRRVMRLDAGDDIRVFNGRDGEWRATLTGATSRDCGLVPVDRLRPQHGVPDLWLGFAPVKRPHIDMIVTKATELGAARLIPTLTRHTMVNRVNVKRLRANVVEAAEQSGRLDVPVLDEPRTLDALLEEAHGRTVYWGDESGDGQSFGEALGDARGEPALLIVGPEGGFAADERDLFRRTSAATAITLGPRILRAETAAIAMLALWQAFAGDWSTRK